MELYLGSPIYLHGTNRENFTQFLPHAIGVWGSVVVKALNY
jgi:hypothetical protein